MRFFTILVRSWGWWILNKTISRWVFYNKSKWHFLTWCIIFECLTIFINFLCSYWIKFSSFFLKLLKTFNRGHKIPFNRFNWSFLGLWGNFKASLWDSYCSKFWFHNCPIKSYIVYNINFIFNSIILKFTCKLNFWIFKTTMITLKRWKHNFFKKRNFCQHKFSYSLFFTVHT
jgi:hypothetical protein